MNRTKLLMASILILLSGILIHISKPVTLSAGAKDKQAPSGHQGHGGAAPAPQPDKPVKPPAKPAAQPAAQEELPTIEIPFEKQQLIGVKTAVVSMRPMQKVIRTVGRVETDEKRVATVNTKYEGWLEKLYADYTGKHVKAGEPLAEIYSPELYATQQEFVNLLKWAKQGREIRNDTIGKMLSKDADSLLDAARQRLKLWDISDEQVKKIEETGQPVRTLTIYSPVGGHITQKNVVQGMRVMPGEKLFDITDLSNVWITADIYEYELPLINIGQAATISLSYVPNKEFTSKIDFIYPVLSGDTRTAKVRFSIPNAEGLLKPQMYTDVIIKSKLQKRLIIPEDAVIDSGTRQIVYIDKGEGYFEPREISIGLRADGMVEVTRGLKPGERIATAANFLIDSEAKLKGVSAPVHKH